MHPTFSNPSLQEEFTKKGYVIIDLFSEEAIDELIKSSSSVPIPDEPFFVSLGSNDKKLKQSAHQVMVDFISNHLDKSLFTEHELIAAGLVVKHPKTGSQMRIHQDWCNVEEQKYSSASLWIPFQDVNKENGCMLALPGSHQLNTLRGPLLPWSCSQVADIDFSLFTELSMKKGQVLIYNLALLHCSWPNNSKQNRYAGIANFIPKEAPAIVYTKSEQEGFSDIYFSSTRFYLEYDFKDATLPEWMKKKETIKIPRGLISKADIAAFI